jgi:hypothetical protein
MEMASTSVERAGATPDAIESLYGLRHREFLRMATAITGSVELGEDV